MLLDALKVVNSVIAQRTRAGSGVPANGCAAKSKTVLEGAVGVTEGDPCLLRILEVVELSIGFLTHVLGPRADPIEEIFVGLVQGCIGLVGARATQALNSGLEWVLASQAS
jgi:hypothetical protein